MKSLLVLGGHSRMIQCLFLLGSGYFGRVLFASGAELVAASHTFD